MRTDRIRPALLGAMLALAGCAPSPGAPVLAGGAPPAFPAHGELGSTTYRAVDRLLAGAPGLPPETSLVVSSIVNTQDLRSTTPFGNIIAEMVRGRLVQRGARVSEPRLRTAMRLDQDQGEFMLARDRHAVVPGPSVAGIVTGTYAIADRLIYVSLKLVSATDARIISAADFAVPADADASALLLRPQAAIR